MFCPSCRSEFQSGFQQCASCEVHLVRALPEADNRFSSAEAMAGALQGNELKPILSGLYTNVVEAQNALAKEKILSVVAPEDGAAYQPGTHERLLLLVSLDDVERVADVFRGRWSEGAVLEGLTGLVADTGAESALVDHVSASECPACGSSVSPQEEECAECGLFVGSCEEAAD